MSEVLLERIATLEAEVERLTGVFEEVGEDRLLTTPQMIGLLQMSGAELNGIDIPKVRKGTKFIRFRHSDVRDWIKNHTVKQ